MYATSLDIRHSIVTGSELRESRALSKGHDRETSSLAIILDHVIAVADVVVVAVVAIFVCRGQ